MSDFTVLNPIYGQYFSGVNPPARVTISVGDSLPEGIDVMLSIIIDKDGKDRKGKVVRSVSRQGLHVQGRSYWAPANIGPYSQAISVQLPESGQSEAGSGSGDMVYVAGQIPLIPASMEVYTERGFQGQATLSLQHLWRIGRAKGVRWWTGAVGFIPAGENAEEKVKIAQQAWKAIHSPSSKRTSSDDGEYDDEDEDEDIDIDPWDRRNNHTAQFNDTTYRSAIPDRTALTSSADPPSVPPCFIVQVESLPRDVDIEWSATGLTASSLSFSRSPLAPLSITHPTSSSARFYTLEIRSPSDTDVLRHLGQESVKDWTSGTLYAGPGFDYEEYGERKFSLRGVQWIPCKRVWGEGGRECAAVLVGRCDGEGDGGMEGVGNLVKGLKFAGREVRDALEMS